MLMTLSTIAMVLSLAGNLLMAKKNILVFPVWIISNFLWIFVNILGSFNLPQVLMYAVYIVIQLYSWREWKMEK